MTDKTIVAEGVWCEKCEFFEVEDYDETRCLACGCSKDLHAPAQVVVEVPEPEHDSCTCGSDTPYDIGPNHKDDCPLLLRRRTDNIFGLEWQQ
jgi:hypothetical protein